MAMLLSSDETLDPNTPRLQDSTLHFSTSTSGTLSGFFLPEGSQHRECIEITLPALLSCLSLGLSTSTAAHARCGVTGSGDVCVRLAKQRRLYTDLTVQCDPNPGYQPPSLTISSRYLPPRFRFLYVAVVTLVYDVFLSFLIHRVGCSLVLEFIVLFTYASRNDRETDSLFLSN